MSGFPNGDIYTCRCACHDPEFASVAKHKDRDVCCDGQCIHCGSFIVHNHMEDHLRDFHPVTIEIPYWLRKSSD